MRFKLWGTRGSIPSPLRSQDIEAKIEAALQAAAKSGVNLNDPTAIRAFVSSLPHAIRGTAGGDTACVEVRSGGNLFILDCGSGLRQLGLELMKEEFGRGQGVAHIFMSHTHWDHMMGWPFFVPGFIPGNEFYIYGVHPDLEARFRLQQKAPSMFPVSLDFQAAKIQFITIQKDSSLEIGQTRITNMSFNHPGGSYGYRIEDDDGILVYTSDSEYKSLDPAATRDFVAFFQDADALLFDAMFSLRESYQKEDWGHSSAMAGADLATRAGVRRLLLFHHDPTYTDAEIWSLRDDAEEYLKQHPDRPPCEIIVAYDGLELELWREARLKAHQEPLSEGIAVHLEGRLTGETTPIALDAIDEAAKQAGSQPLVVDLSAVIHVDHEGLKALLSARRQWRPLALSGLSPDLERSFAQADALDYFATFDTPPEALAALIQGTDLRPNQVLSDRYKVGPRLRRGSLGDIYLATDQTNRRQVAVQVLCPSLGSKPRELLMRAARPATRLRHRLIAGTLAVGQDGPIRYLVLEHTLGQSLAQQSLTSAPEAVQIGRQVVRALEYAHSQNVIHGALEPQSIIQTDGQIKVSRFGTGRLEIDKPLSKLPTHMGQIDYLAPEQLQGLGSSPASDLYALGIILYEISTGSRPFSATASDEDLINLQLRQQPVPPRRRNPDISRSFEHLILRLLKKRPRERPAHASDVYQILTSLAQTSFEGPLLGRESLHKKLNAYLNKVAQGASGLLFLHGQRGVGKSRLVQAIINHRAVDQGPFTLYGELFAAEDTRPYKIFVKALRSALFNLPAHQLTQLLNDLGDLSEPLKILLPDLRPSLSTLSLSNVECQQLEEAICETFRLLAHENEMLLILDSLQWIDVSSLGLLEKLAQQEIPKLLIVGLYRTREVPKNHPLRQTLSTLEPLIDEQIPVTPLSPIDVHQMTSMHNTLQQVPPDFSLWLYSETQGNPFHIEQVIQAYLEGPNETRHHYERMTALTLEDLILRRLERLSQDTLVALRQASVLGHTFHFDTLRAVLDQPEQETLTHLLPALRSQILLGHPSEDQYRFSHPLIREVIYDEMLGGVRRRYYRRAAHVLEERGVSGALDEKIDLLAHYLLHAGEPDQAVAYLARASVRARQLCAYQAALNYVDQALDVVQKSLQTTIKEEEQLHRQKQRKDLLAARRKLEKLIAPQTPAP